MTVVCSDHSNASPASASAFAFAAAYGFETNANDAWGHPAIVFLETYNAFDTHFLSAYILLHRSKTADAPERLREVSKRATVISENKGKERKKKAKKHQEIYNTIGLETLRNV